MRTKILYSITALLIFTFAFVVYASLSSAKTTVIASDEKCCAMKDCCKDGKCSMSTDGKCNCAAKKDNKAEHKCTEECCKDGKCTMNADGKCGCNDANCTMHKKDGNNSTHNHSGKAGCCQDGKCSMSGDCCKDGVCKMGCCKDGKCEMHKKDGESAKGGCCKGDSCQMKKGEKKDTTKTN